MEGCCVEEIRGNALDYWRSGLSQAMGGCRAGRGSVVKEAACCQEGGGLGIGCWAAAKRREAKVRCQMWTRAEGLVHGYRRKRMRPERRDGDTDHGGVSRWDVGCGLCASLEVEERRLPLKRWSWGIRLWLGLVLHAARGQVRSGPRGG